MICFSFVIQLEPHFLCMYRTLPDCKFRKDFPNVSIALFMFRMFWEKLSSTNYNIDVQLIEKHKH